MSRTYIDMFWAQNFTGEQTKTGERQPKEEISVQKILVILAVALSIALAALTFCLVVFRYRSSRKGRKHRRERREKQKKKNERKEKRKEPIKVTSRLRKLRKYVSSDTSRDASTIGSDRVENLQKATKKVFESKNVKSLGSRRSNSSVEFKTVREMPIQDIAETIKIGDTAPKRITVAVPKLVPAKSERTQTVKKSPSRRDRRSRRASAASASVTNASEASSASEVESSGSDPWTNLMTMFGLAKPKKVQFRKRRRWTHL